MEKGKRVGESQRGRQTKRERERPLAYDYKAKHRISLGL